MDINDDERELCAVYFCEQTSSASRTRANHDDLTKASYHKLVHTPKPGTFFYRVHVCSLRDVPLVLLFVGRGMAMFNDSWLRQ